MDATQRMIGARWLREEWKPNMVELEVIIVFEERKEKYFQKQGQAFSKYLTNFEPGKYNYVSPIIWGNILFS